MSNKQTNAWSWVGITLSAIGVFSLVLAIVLIAAYGNKSGSRGGVKGDNCTILTCPAGAAGPQGLRGSVGPPGAQGERGEQGPRGDPGPMGLPGPIGPMGQCSNSNPFCTRGDTGPTGPQGIPGATGIAGLIGPTGPQGVAGPQGVTGPQGPSGPSGPIGVQGVQGIPGVCNCLTLSLVNLMDLGVSGNAVFNGTVTLNGIMDCPGGALSLNCFGVAACPDYSDCVLTMLGLNIFSDNITQIPSLLVGMGADDLGQSVVSFGQPGGQQVSVFQANVNGTYTVQTTTTHMLHRSFLSDATFESLGAPTLRTNILSSGIVIVDGTEGVTITADNGSIFAIAGTNTLQINPTSNAIALTTTTTTLRVTDFTVVKSSLLPWFTTQSALTYTCQTGLLPSVVGTSVLFSTDVVMESGAAILSKSANGLVRITGLDMCGSVIRTAGTTLQLQDDSATKILDVRAFITNNQGINPVSISDAQGLNLPSTPLYDSSGSPLQINTAFGAFVGGDIDMSEIGKLVTVRGDLTVQGTLTAAICAGCASDARVKLNVTEVTPASDLDVILSLPRRVSFEYNAAYKRVDRFVRDHIQHGFVAQELERVLPQVVSTTNYTLDGIHIPDFRRIMYERVVPFVTGAVKELHLRQHAAELKHALLQREHALLQEAHAALSERLTRLERLMSHTQK